MNNLWETYFILLNNQGPFQLKLSEKEVTLFKLKKLYGTPYFLRGFVSERRY